MGWKVEAVDPPVLTNEQWSLVSLLGAVFLVMALLQLISFSDFKDALNNMGLASGATWAGCLILAELWAAAGLFKWRLSSLFRMVSASLAVLVSGFWFVENLQVVSNGTGQGLQNSGFFGRFLHQTPGWWTVLEVTLLLFWTLYTVGLFRAVMMMPKHRVIK
jgi:hypothetical protein